MTTTPVRTAYLSAAGSALELLRQPAVADAWDRPSALDGMTVGGLAAHLSTQLVRVPELVAGPAGTDPVTLRTYYGREPWVGAAADAEVNVGIRDRARDLAAPGPVAIVDRAASALGRAREVLPGEAPDRLVVVPWAGWSVALDDFLITRMMEIAVHSDDLAVSVGLPTPELPDAVVVPVLALLTDVAVQRRGQVAVLRALTRAERAPATITAF